MEKFEGSELPIMRLYIATPKHRLSSGKTELAILSENKDSARELGAIYFDIPESEVNISKPKDDEKCVNPHLSEEDIQRLRNKLQEELADIEKLEFAYSKAEEVKE